MKKIILFIFFTLTITTLSSCEQEAVVQKHYKTEIVKTGSLNTSISYSSFTEWITETLLSSKSGWRIISTFKNKWDRVKAWEKIAIIDSDEAKVWVNTSNNIINSLENLKISTSETYDAQIKAVQESLNKAKQTLEWVKTEKENTLNINASEIVIYENKLNETELNLELVNKNLKETKWILELQKNQIYKNAINAITSALILDTNIIKYVDDFLGITPENKNKNDNFDKYLSVKNSEHLKDATSLFNEANKNYIEYKNYYENYIEDKDATNKQIIEWLKKWRNLAENIKKLLNSTNDVIQNSIDTIYLTQVELNNYRENIYAMWNSIEASIITISWEYPIWLKWSLDSIDLIEKNINKQIILLEWQVNLAKKQVDIANTNLEKIKNISISNIDTINTNKEIWNINISEIKAGIESLKKQKNSKLQEINTQIQEAIWNKNIWNVMIWNSEILATYNWIITEKFTEIWQVIAWWSPVYKLSDDRKIKLKVSLNNSIIKNLKLKDKVKIVIEWVSHDFVWRISNIPDTQDKISKNTQIEILINNFKHEIIVWSTAKVYLKNTSESWIIIPNKAIISDFMIPSVMIIKNNIAQLKNIEIINGNDDFSLIEWIDAWEIIIVEGQENIWDWEKLE